jgi:hypothetical protein
MLIPAAQSMNIQCGGEECNFFCSVSIVFEAQVQGRTGSHRKGYCITTCQTVCLTTTIPAIQNFATPFRLQIYVLDHSFYYKIYILKKMNGQT